MLEIQLCKVCRIFTMYSKNIYWIFFNLALWQNTGMRQQMYMETMTHWLSSIHLHALQQYIAVVLLGLIMSCVAYLHNLPWRRVPKLNIVYLFIGCCLCWYFYPGTFFQIYQSKFIPDVGMLLCCVNLKRGKTFVLLNILSYYRMNRGHESEPLFFMLPI